MSQRIMQGPDTLQLPLPFPMKVTPFPRQLRAAAAMLRARTTKWKGMILADQTGLGKTGAALIAARAAYDPRRGPSVIVVPAACLRQWRREYRRFFFEVCAYDDSFYFHRLTTPSRMTSQSM
jgi:SNF2 family DNA or RNA helicase